MVSPLRRHALPPITDGAAAIVLAAGDKARAWSERPVWITGFDHRMETHSLGARDLTGSPSTVKAADVAGVADGPVDVAELHAPYAHQEIILKEALGLDDGVAINPSGGAAGRQPDHVGRPDPHRRGRRPHRLGPGQPGGGPRHLGPVPATESRLRPGG